MRTYGECERCGIEDNSMRGPHLCQSCMKDDEIKRLREALRGCLALLEDAPEYIALESVLKARAALAGAPSAVHNSDKTEQNVAQNRALAERVRSRIAALAYDAGRPDLCDKVRALDLDALMGQGEP